MTARILDGKALAATIRDEVAREVVGLREQGVHPTLKVILVGDDPASEVYVRNKQRDAEAVGMGGDTVKLPEDTPEKELLALIEELNADDGVHGILCQLPVPPHIDAQRVLAAIDPAKDVDGFHPVNQGLLLQGTPRFVPATPRGIIEMLLRNNIEPRGRNVVILGRSNIVGKPLAALLMAKGPGGDATVTVCHSRTQNLRTFTTNADIIVAAIGSPEFLGAGMVKPGATVIDVGINRLEDGKLVGDVAFDQVAEVAGALTPVPGGVGPVTRAMLLKNTLEAARAFLAR